MSLRDGTVKMSKSDPSDMSRINLADDADTIPSKIKSKTDPEPAIDPPGLRGGQVAKNWWAYAALPMKPWRTRSSL
jgi:tryptophanyl-tRNA synthetase